jgi:hypothetical protein
LRSSIGELQRLLDDPSRLRTATPPDLSGASRPAALVDVPDVPQAPAAPAEQAPVNDVAVIDLGGSGAPAADDSGFAPPTTGGVTYSAPDESDAAPPTASARAPRGGRVAVADDDSEGWDRFAKAEPDGPPTMAIPAGDAGDDAYLTELRKAMLDDTSASTLEPDEHRTRTRFGRRR